MIIADPICYAINSISMGDVIAAAPVVSWAIRNFHQDGNYKVLTIPHYRSLFHFVPDENYGDQRTKHSFNPPWQIRYLNTPKSANARTTSMRMHLSDFASIQLTDRIIPKDDRFYLPVPKVDISHFGLDTSKCVFIIVTYRDSSRKITFEAVKGIAEHVAAKGLVPVYVGREDNDAIWQDSPFKMSFDSLPKEGVSLVNKTSMAELVSLMAGAKCVVGMDSGPIHLAGTTEVPIVCGYTSVSPEVRYPLRMPRKLAPVIPTSPCRHCQNRWALNYHDFGTCYFKHTNCVNELTAEKFISALDTFI